MDRTVNTPHEMLNPSTLPKPTGFSHAVVAAPGRLVFLAGKTGHRTDGSIDQTVEEQFEQAAKNVAIALKQPTVPPSTSSRCRSSSPTSPGTGGRWGAR